MQAGKLRHRVTVQDPAETRSPGGERVQTWTAVTTVWADIRPATAREIEAGDKNNLQLTHMVEVRWQDGVFLPERRLLFKTTRAFEIVGALNPSERGISGMLQCLEVEL